MGNSELKTESLPKLVSPKDFSKIQPIGRGGFGCVYLIKYKKNQKFYALKQMLKAKIAIKNSINSVLKERLLLSKIKHPFLVNMRYACQDRTNLYLIMDLMTGGDLRYHLTKHKTFNENTTKFFTACILIGLEYLHVNGIIHRDIKPENLVFDSKGYLRITDFGISNFVSKNNFEDASGTPGYMSPEVMMRKNHGIEADYFALGVIVYECMTGTRPYVGKDKKELKNKIISTQVQLKKSQVPKNWSLESVDFVNKLIQRDPKKRLGANGPQEIKNHSWIQGFEWKKLFEKKIPSPYSVGNVDYDSYKCGNDVRNEGEESVDVDYIQNLFEEYYFDQGIGGSGVESTILSHKISNNKSM